MKYLTGKQILFFPIKNIGRWQALLDAGDYFISYPLILFADGRWDRNKDPISLSKMGGNVIESGICS